MDAKFQLDDWTYGALSTERDNPLSDVSIANSSLSIDMLKGCALQCAYCHIQGAVRNLDEGGLMPKRASNISIHTPQDVLQALRMHPVYTPQSVISIGTASTEPLVPEAITNTLEIMQACIDLGMQNPIWIVTKAGISEKALAYVRENANRQQIIISPTWGGANKTIEPAQNDRFLGSKEAAKAGAQIMLYLRPIVPEWGSDKAKITHILMQARLKIGDGISVIAPGGLRWTEGVEYGLSRRNIPWPSSIPKIDNEKELSEDMWGHIFGECERIFPGIPVVRNSSCGLSHILARPDIGAKHYVQPGACASSQCSAVQRSICARQRDLLGGEDLKGGIKNRIYASTGLSGMPLLTDQVDFLGWLNRLPYDLRITTTKSIADYGQ